MSIKKLIGFLCVCVLNFNASAMQANRKTINDVPVDLIAYVLDFLWPQTNPNVPVSYLCLERAITPFAQTSRAYRNLSLLYTESRIINGLIKFDTTDDSVRLNPANEVDFVAACCAFKIILKIRKTVPAFCDKQFVTLQQYFKNKMSISNDLICPSDPGFFKKIGKSVLQPIFSKIQPISNCPTGFYDKSVANDSIFRAILNSEDVNFSSKATYGGTALYFAVGQNDLHWIRILLAAGANVDAIINLPGDSYGLRPLNMAIADGSSDVVELLCLAGADVNVCIENDSVFRGCSPLLQIVFMAASTDKIKSDDACNIIFTLVKSGARLDERIMQPGTWYGRTALGIASCFNTPTADAICEFLKILGANPNTLDLRDMHDLDSLEGIAAFLGDSSNIKLMRHNT